MDRKARDVIRKGLDPNEELLWSGIPRQGVFLQFRDLWMIPLSLLWGSFAFFWEYQAVQRLRQSPDNEAVLMALFGLPFVLVGLYWIFGRFFFDAWRRRHTFYGLTDKRVVIVSGKWRRKVRSLLRENLIEVTLTEQGGGRGTLVFGHDAPLQYQGDSYIRGPRAPRFEQIENARQVYRQIMEG